MAFSCGFYNAIDHDRTYSAAQFGEMFDGLITDGVYSTIGEAMMVAPGTGVGVVVKSGRAWFNKTWSVNTTDFPLDLGMADLLLPRVDTVVLEVDTRVSVRNNSLKVVQGYPAVNPVPASLSQVDGLYQYPLAYVNVKANATAIEKTDIEVKVGQAPCPFVTGILQSVDITTAFQQWEGQFEEWFADVKSQLSGDIAGNLLHRIELLEDGVVYKTDKATEAEAIAGTEDSHFITPKGVHSFYIGQKATATEITNRTAIDHWLTPESLKGLDTDLSSIRRRIMQINRKEFTTTQKWTSPSNLASTMVFVIAQGGGGGSAGNPAGSSAVTTRGGNGLIAIGIGTANSPGYNNTITIGGGGSAGGTSSISAATGGAGGTTTAFGVSAGGGYGSSFSYNSASYDKNKVERYSILGSTMSGAILGIRIYDNAYFHDPEYSGDSSYKDGIAAVRAAYLMGEGFSQNGAIGISGSVKASGNKGSAGRVVIYYLTWN